MIPICAVFHVSYLCASYQQALMKDKHPPLRVCVCMLCVWLCCVSWRETAPIGSYHKRLCSTFAVRVGCCVCVMCLVLWACSVRVSMLSVCVCVLCVLAWNSSNWLTRIKYACANRVMFVCAVRLTRYTQYDSSCKSRSTICAVLNFSYVCAYQRASTTPSHRVITSKLSLKLR